MKKNNLDVAKWNYFKGTEDGFDPKPMQLCWVRLFETHGQTILEESYHLALNVHIHREEWKRKENDEDRHQDNFSKKTKTEDVKYYEFINVYGRYLGDGSGTELYQWKPCVSEFQQWGDAVKWKAIKTYNKRRHEWEKNRRDAYNIIKERCISQVNLKVNPGID